MDNNLYIISSNELTNAITIQQQISQKEFEIKLVDINSKYTSIQDSSSYYYNQQRKTIMEFELSNLKIQRDGHINTSLANALGLAEMEIMSHISFSSAAIAISSIHSFLSINNIQLILNSLVIMKISTISSQLLFSPGLYMSLRIEITKLKTYFQLA